MMYLEDLRDCELPRGTFHIARRHMSGKLWISDNFSFPTRERAEREVTDFQDGNAQRNAYLVWNYDEWFQDHERQPACESVEPMI